MTTINNSDRVIRRLYEITNNYDLGFDKQIQQLLQMGLERFNLDIAIISKIEGNQYVVKHCVVPDEVDLSSNIEFEFELTYCHITCKAKKPVAIEHIGKHDQYASHPAYEAFGLESYIGMPLRINGKLYGTLNFSSPNPYPRKFKDVDIDALQLMASWVEVEIIRRRQEKRLQELNLALEKKAYEDSLTELPNRRALFKHFNIEMNRITREQGEAALAIIDIDLFKSVNDKYGHQKGDEVLTSVAQSIKNDKRDYDFLARMGGEEFLLWLPNTTLAEANKICERIKNHVAQLSVIDKPITISTGITHFSTKNHQPIDIEHQIDQLIAEADDALYQAKDDGRNCVKVFMKTEK
jgi:diguanylate cyclase (GGDEF)-like protein